MARASLAVAHAVERGKDAAREFAGFGQNRLDHVRRRVGETGEIGIAAEAEHVAEYEKRVGDRRLESSHPFATSFKKTASVAAPVNGLFTMFIELSPGRGERRISSTLEPCHHIGRVRQGVNR
jgi:hypothetical protein